MVMKMTNYLNLNQHPVKLSFRYDRTTEFREIYHSHQGMEILVVHEGEGTVVVGQQIIGIGPGSFVYFRPFQLHRIRQHPAENRRYIRSLFVFEPSIVDAALQPFPGLRTYFRAMCEGTLGPHGFSLGDPERLLEEQLLFLTAFLHYVSSRTPEQPGADHTPSRVRAYSVAEQVMDWIETHYKEEFELKRLADEIHLSPNHVSAAFRKSVGSNITDYLAARRIRQACWLLTTSDLSIREVGESVGLPNGSYFCQWFRKHIGVSPKAYRHSR